MIPILAVAKIGRDVLESTDPNDFIFHSSYNTFKIIEENTKTVTLAALTNNQSFSEPHGLEFIPLPAAFARQNGIDQVFLPNADNIDLWTAKLGWLSTGIRFNYIATNDENIIFNFDNSNGSPIDVYIRYFLLEKVD